MATLRVAFCGLVLGFGALCFDPEAGDGWLALTVLLYGLPLAAQGVPVGWVRVYGAWLGFFLVLQALIRPAWVASDYLTLPPNLDRQVDSRGLRGIEGFQHFTTDEKGFRVTKPIDYTDDASYRIFAIGGSTTKQANLGDRNSWTHRLQESLPSPDGVEIEVINTGLHGLMAVNHLATLRETLSLHPDLYLFLLGANDWVYHQHLELTPRGVRLQEHSLEKTLLGRVIRRLAAQLGRRSEQPRRRLEDELVEDLPRAAADADEVVDPYLTKRGSLYRKKQLVFKPDRVREAYAETLREIARLCREHAVQCVFATQPTGYQHGISSEFKQSFGMTSTDKYKESTLSFDSMVHLAKLYNDHLIAFAAEEGFPLCDLAAVLEPSFANYYDEMHFNEAGARRVAAYLRECIAPLVERDLDVKPGAATPRSRPPSAASGSARSASPT